MSDAAKNKNELTDCEAQKLNSLLTSLLGYFDRLCKRNGLRYFLTEETLLAAVLIHDLLPQSSRIAAAMPRSDYEKLLLLMRGKTEEGRLEFFIPGRDGSSYYPYARILMKRTEIVTKKTFALDKEQSKLSLDIFSMDASATVKGSRWTIKRAGTWTSALRKKLISKRLASGTETDEDQELLSFEYGKSEGIEAQIKEFFPKSIALRLRDGVIKKMSSETKEYLFYVRTGDEGSYDRILERQLVMPGASISIGPHAYTVPSKAHEVLTNFYGDYHAMLLKSAEINPIKNISLDEVFWADVIHAKDPAILL